MHQRSKDCEEPGRPKGGAGRMDCKQVSEILFLLLDNELDRERLAPAEDHLAHCPTCAQRYEYSRRVVVLVRKRCIRVTAPSSLRLRILTSLPHRRAT